MFISFSSSEQLIAMNSNICLLVITILLQRCKCDYLCLCNNNIERFVYKNADDSETPVGALYEYDCNTLIADVDPLWATIAYHHKVAFVEKNSQTRVQVCHGDVSELDKLLITAGVQTMAPSTHPTIAAKTSTVTTISKTNPTLPLQTTLTDSATSTRTMTIPTINTSSTSRRLTTPSKTLTATGANNSSPVLEGHTELCPDYIKNTDVNRFHGFLGQYGEFCYELVDAPTQWILADRHCKLVSSGSLVHILSQNEQDYIVKFLSNHSYVQTIWLGLTDNGFIGGYHIHADEGNWFWSSGATYNYNNFGADFTSHSQHEHDLYDCAVMKQGGEWTDVSCGVVLVLGLGAGESHPYICQYNVSA